MKKLYMLMAIAVSILLSSGVAFANDPTKCGLPSFAFKSSIPNVIINFFTSMPTYTLAVTSGTSNCGGIVQLPTKEMYYVQNTYDELSEEVAQGDGPHLKTLSAMIGCKSQAYKPFADMAQDNYQRLFPETTSQQSIPKAQRFLDTLKAQISQHPQLAENCTINPGT